jgi:hypothetical protein
MNDVCFYVSIYVCILGIKIEVEISYQKQQFSFNLIGL